jgi:hypothetical protein
MVLNTMIKTISKVGNSQGLILDSALMERAIDPGGSGRRDQSRAGYDTLAAISGEIIRTKFSAAFCLTRFA